ncbi:hypothetical protein CC80DRAFT_172499 [Byssothecium circinans]|uniref:Uncharacterized protein n=1 Tax=Byssothecium circinans TaxID=147558 RepID=A0A6A5TIM6_9PLEO|nr:hypothetical protein CC80DRAFT_172499 [Byssothecium circinans]
MSAYDTEEFTATLNTTSQLCSITSIALPVHDARKLGRRVVNYFDHLSQADTNAIRSIGMHTATQEKTKDLVRFLPHRDSEGGK